MFRWTQHIKELDEFLDVPDISEFNQDEANDLSRLMTSKE